jgi:hypothetical protein
MSIDRVLHTTARRPVLAKRKNVMQQQDLSKGEVHTTSAKRSHKTGAPEGIRARGREQDMLEMFIGTWQVRGYNEPSPLGSGRTEVMGTQKYVWLPGEFFVRGSWNHRFGARVHQGTSLLGFEPDQAAYFAHIFDNLGYARTYVVALAGRVWTFSGQFERATFAFSEDCDRYQETWELTRDGHTWLLLGALEATRFRG